MTAVSGTTLNAESGLTYDGSTLAVTGGGSYTGDLTVLGTLTYEDVKNVDSAGIATARQGLNVTGGGIHVTSGVVTATSFTGNLTGNVTGNVSGSSGSSTGNAATATKLANARTIGGVSFDAVSYTHLRAHETN